MKLGKIETLLRAVSARTRLERASLAAVARARASLLADAETLTAEARAPLEGAEPLTGADFAVYGRNQTRLERAADARRAMAHALEPRKAAHTAALKAALRKEIAWESLADAAREARRKAFNDREEERREAVVQMRRPEGE